jgi:uncharacterized protein (TIGR02466 family)
VEQFKIISADLFVENVGTPEQIEALKQEALAQKLADPKGLPFTNENCWRSRFTYKDIDWLVQELGKLVETAIAHYIQEDPLYKKKVMMYKNPEIDYWTNINDKYGKNSLHNHKTYQYVACYYIQAEDTGELAFHNPTNVMEECNPTSPFVSRINYKPKTGDLVVWPAWVPHEVEMNFSEQQRINIAFNIRF